MKYFIEIGSNNYDTCVDLAETGFWKGVVVEPIPEIFKLIKRNHNCFYENLAIDEKEGEVNFYYYPEITGWGSLNVNHVKKLLFDHPELKNLKQIKVKSLTINQLIKKYNFPRIDLLKIDAESHDGKIIKALDFTITKIKKIKFEYMHLDPVEIQEVTTYLNNNNMRLEKQDESNLNFININD